MSKKKVMYPTGKFFQAKKRPGRKRIKVPRPTLEALGITAKKKTDSSRGYGID